MGLTLDEFAMWLRLTDVDWTPRGVESLTAGAVVAALLALYGFGQPLWHAVVTRRSPLRVECPECRKRTLPDVEEFHPLWPPSCNPSRSVSRG